MMGEKRFTSFIEDDGYWIRDESDFKIIATGLKFGVAENLIAMLNELNDENKKLRQERERWKTLYEIKDKEVTARVDSLNKVCEYYLTEVLFKSDVDPNKAVKEVINEILNTEVEM